MDFFTYNSEFVMIDILEDYKSVLWVERFNDLGDFEMILPTTSIDEVVSAKYISKSGSDRLMVIEKMNIITDAEEGGLIKISGRSIDRLLLKRVIVPQTIIRNNINDAIKSILNDTMISPLDPDRQIDNLVFVDSSDMFIMSQYVTTQFTGDTVLSAIQSICKPLNIGFKIVLTDDRNLEFSLYTGVDRSYNQLLAPHVVFSSDFDNLRKTTFETSSMNYSNIAYIGGDGEGSDRALVMIARSGDDVTGLLRDEIFTDARDVSRVAEEGQPYDYTQQLIQRGVKDLSDHTIERVFDGEIDIGGNYTFGVDYFLGDIVQIENEYKIEGAVRIMEIIYSKDTSSETMYPTFINV